MSFGGGKTDEVTRKERCARKSKLKQVPFFDRAPYYIRDYNASDYDGVGSMKPPETEKEQKEKIKSPLEALLGDTSPNPPIAYTVGTYRPVCNVQSQVSGKVYTIGQMGLDLFSIDGTIVVYGKRRSGKTFFVRMLLFYLRPVYPLVVCFCKTKASAEYGDIIPDDCIIQGYNKEILDSLLAYQKTQKEAYTRGTIDEIEPLLIIMDDCLSDNIKYQDRIDEVFWLGRHLDTCMIIISQDIKGLMPDVTANIDQAVMFKPRAERDKEAIRVKFCDYFKNNVEFEEIVKPILDQPYHCVMADQSNPYVAEELSLFAGQASEPPPFVLGCRNLWRGHEQQLHNFGFGHLADMDEWPMGLDLYLEQRNNPCLNEELDTPVVDNVSVETVVNDAQKSKPQEKIASPKQSKRKQAH